MSIMRMNNVGCINIAILLNEFLMNFTKKIKN